MKQNRHKAFSLIELSIVILIIGIIIAGIVQGSRLVKKFKLQTAQSLTKNSPVSGINDLVLWYETSLPESFITSEASDGLPISTWYDINTQQPNKLNATQGTAASQPIYTENRINGLPAIVFDGSDDYMDFSGRDIVGTDYTVFAVGQRTSNDQFNFIIAGASTSAEGVNLALGWRINTQVWMYNGSGVPTALSYTVPGYSRATPAILTAWFNQTSGKKLWFNGGSTPDVSNSTATTALSSYGGASLGRFSGNYAHIEISEVIIFRRSLTTEDRQEVEKYLSKKYNITIS